MKRSPTGSSIIWQLRYHRRRHCMCSYAFGFIGCNWDGVWFVASCHIWLEATNHTETAYGLLLLVKYDKLSVASMFKSSRPLVPTIDLFTLVPVPAASQPGTIAFPCPWNVLISCITYDNHGCHCLEGLKTSNDCFEQRLMAKIICSGVDKEWPTMAETTAFKLAEGNSWSTIGDNECSGKKIAACLWRRRWLAKNNSSVWPLQCLLNNGGACEGVDCGKDS